MLLQRRITSERIVAAGDLCSIVLQRRALWSPRRCGQAGNLIAAFAVGGTGDWELLPTLSDVEGELRAIAD